MRLESIAEDGLAGANLEHALNDGILLLISAASPALLGDVSCWLQQGL